MRTLLKRRCRWLPPKSLLLSGFTLLCTAFTEAAPSGIPFYIAEVQQQLSGKVTGTDGEPLMGVTVQNMTTKAGAITNFDGKFSIQASEGDILEFSMMGYHSKSVTIQNVDTTVGITLEEGVMELEETIVTALAIKREERSLGYAVSQVDGEEVQKVRIPNVVNALAGKVAGLSITSSAGGPTGSSRVVIRGNTTITGSNQPLYVIDGVPMDNSNYGQVSSSQYGDGYDMGDAISAINPDDIDKISVLKGPSAAALYGSRAANGVILITTKKGDQQKELGIELNSTITFEKQLTRYDDHQHLYGQGRNQTLPQDETQARSSLFSNFGPRLDPNLMMTYYDGVERPYALVKDNISNFFRTGITYSNNVALSSYSDKASFRLAVLDMKNEDIIPESDFRRNSFTFNGSANLGEKLKVSGRAFYLKEKVNNRPGLADDPSNIGNNFIGLANNVDQALFKDYYKDEDGTYVNWGGGQYRLNPYWVINEMENTTRKDRFMGMIQANYTINDWLSIQGRIATDITYIDFRKFAPRTTPGSLVGRLNLNDQAYYTTEADVLLSFEKQFTPDFNFSAKLGGSLSRISNKRDSWEFLNMTVTDVVSPNSFADKSIVSTHYRKKNNSAYLLLNAGYKRFLYLDATIRQDASSTLPEDNNTYYYPSLSGSFVFTEALNWKNDILSFGKIRASAAEVANDTDPYQLDLYYQLNPLSFNGTSVGGIAGTTLPNPDLKPTRTRSFETGLELKFLKNRIGLDLTYYNQRSRDQINRVPIPISSGFTYQMINAGVVTNEGVEIVLSTKPVVNKNFQWTLNMNMAFNENKVESLAEGVPFLSMADARWMGVSVVAMPEAPYGAILGYGYQRDPQGNIILNSNTLMPVISEERQVIGQGVFKWTGGLYSAFTYKNITLTTNLDIKLGGDIFAMSNLFSDIRGLSKKTLEGREEWIRAQEEGRGMTEEEMEAAGISGGYVPQGVVQTSVDEQGNPVYEQNTRAVNPSEYWSGIYSDGNGIAVPYIYDASYVKMRELTLSYSLPSTLVSRWGLSAVSVALISRNPFIIYKNVPNIDPDSNYNNSNGQGLEYGSLPSRRSMGFNFKIKF